MLKDRNDILLAQSTLEKYNEMKWYFILAWYKTTNIHAKRNYVQDNHHALILTCYALNSHKKLWTCCK